MKSPIRHPRFATMLAVALCAPIHTASASGTTPAADKTPVVERSVSILPLTLEVSGDEEHELRTLRDFTITVQGEEDFVPEIVVGPVNPFTEQNTCTRPMPEGIDGCVVNGDATVGTLRVNWPVPQAGTYRFILSAKRGSSGRVETIGAFDLEARD
jgi:hypothetical protein